MHHFVVVIYIYFFKVISLLKYGPIHCKNGLPNDVLV